MRTAQRPCLNPNDRCSRHKSWRRSHRHTSSISAKPLLTLTGVSCPRPRDSEFSKATAAIIVPKDLKSYKSGKESSGTYVNSHRADTPSVSLPGLSGSLCSGERSSHFRLTVRTVLWYVCLCIRLFGVSRVVCCQLPGPAGEQVMDHSGAVLSTGNPCGEKRVGTACVIQSFCEGGLSCVRN